MIAEKIDRTKPYVLSGNNIFISNSHYSDYNISLYGLPYEMRGVEKRDVTKENALDTIFRSKNLKKFMLNQIEKGVYSFNVAVYTPKDVFFKDEININDIVDYLTLYDNEKNKKLMSNIRHELDRKNRVKQIYLGRINKNHSFNSIIKIMREDPEIFKRKIDNNMYKISAHELVELVNPISWEEFTKGILSKKDIELITSNRDYLLSNYQKNEEMELDFEGEHVDVADLRPEIIDLIEQDMPDNLKQTEKAYFAYRRVCQMFSFDEHVVIGGRTHWNIYKVNDIMPWDQVTCGEITIIFCKYLEKENIPYKIVGYNFDEKDVFKEHLSLMFKTDEMLIHADPANRQIKNDMSASKGLYPTNWFRLIGDNYKAKKNLRKYKKHVDEILDKHYINEDHKNARELIKNIKKENLSSLSTKEKIELATDTIAKIKLQPVDMLELNDDITETLFGKDNRVFVVFLIVKRPEQEKEQSKLVLCISSNENGLQEDYENNTYTIIREGKVLEKSPWDEMKDNIGYDEEDYRPLRKSLPGIDRKTTEKGKGHIR